MSVQAGSGIQAWWGSIRFAPMTASYSGPWEHVENDVTNMASGGFVERIPGLASRTGLITGFSDEEVADADLATNPQWWLTECKDASPAVGVTTHSFVTHLSDYTKGGAVGAVYALQLEFVNRNKTVLNGIHLHSGVITASGNSAGNQFGAVSAAQTLNGLLHVDEFNISGTSPTLDVVIQQDVDNTFASPLAILTFDQVTASTNTQQRKTSAGPHTDEWYRVNLTIGGSATPTFRIFVVLAKIAT